MPNGRWQFIIFSMKKKPSKSRTITFFTLLSAILLLSLTSCRVSEKLTLTNEQTLEGRNHIDLSVSDYFVSVIEDLSNWEASGENDPVIDVAMDEFVQNLENSSTTSNIRFRKAGVNTYMGDFSFNDFKSLVVDLSNGNADQSIVTTTKNGDTTHVSIRIGMDNYEDLTKMVPFLANPNFEVYGPLYNHDLTEENYLEMMGFILGEECPQEITESTIKIQVVAPKAVTDHDGTLKNAKTVEFSFPLIDFLLLHEPIEFWLEY